jgi:hypothetical protein
MFSCCRCGDALAHFVIRRAPAGPGASIWAVDPAIRTTPKMSDFHLQPACSIVGGAGRMAQKIRPRASATVGVAAGARRFTLREDGGANCGTAQIGGE